MLLRRLLLSRTSVLAAGIASFAVVASVAVVLALGAADGSGEAVALVPSPTVEPSATRAATATPPPSPTATMEPTAEPTALPHIPGTNPDDRIVIPSANVDAPIILETVPLQGGELPSPDGPDDVAFYDFTGFPGFGGYPGSGGVVVLSGHVDYGGGYCDNGTEPPPCTAVFWDLTLLEPGDVVELHLPDGTHRYRVTGSDNIGADDLDKWATVWTAPESGERISLITCGGDFNRETHEYTSRHVVYGERIGDET